MKHTHSHALTRICSTQLNDAKSYPDSFFFRAAIYAQDEDEMREAETNDEKTEETVLFCGKKGILI